MESKGKMLVALSLIAVLSGFSAITYVAVQRNANVNSRAATSPASSGSATSTTRLPSCTTNQDCFDFIASMCKTDSAVCPSDNIPIECVSGICTVTGVSATATGTGTAGGASGAGSSLTSLAGTPDPSASGSNTGTTPGTNPGTNPGPSCGTKSKGDYDCNGKTECADLTLFVNEFTGKVATKTSDVTNDGKVSLADFEIGRVGAVGAGSAWASCQL